MTVVMMVDGIDLKMEIDTGASIMLMSEETYFKKPQLDRVITDSASNMHWRTVDHIGICISWDLY